MLGDLGQPAVHTDEDRVVAGLAPDGLEREQRGLVVAVDRQDALVRARLIVSGPEVVDYLQASQLAQRRDSRIWIDELVAELAIHECELLPRVHLEIERLECEERGNNAD